MSALVVLPGPTVRAIIVSEGDGRGGNRNLRSSPLDYTNEEYGSMTMNTVDSIQIQNNHTGKGSVRRFLGLQSERPIDGRLALVEIERELIDSGHGDIVHKIAAEIAESRNGSELWTRVGRYLKHVSRTIASESSALREYIDIFLDACRDRGISLG